MTAISTSSVKTQKVNVSRKILTTGHRKSQRNLSALPTFYPKKP
jgi:hypothetical protein